MWYKCLRDLKKNQCFKNVEVSPCIFIKWTHTTLVIVAVYVDDLNIIDMIDIISKIVSQLKGEFEMKDLGETTFCLGLQVEHLARSIFYIKVCILKSYSSVS